MGWKCWGYWRGSPITLIAGAEPWMKGRKDATGVTNCLMATIGVLLGEDNSKGCAVGICVEVKLLAEVRLDEAWE